MTILIKGGFRNSTFRSPTFQSRISQTYLFVCFQRKGELPVKDFRKRLRVKRDGLKKYANISLDLLKISERHKSFYTSSLTFATILHSVKQISELQKTGEINRCFKKYHCNRRKLLRNINPCAVQYYLFIYLSINRTRNLFVHINLCTFCRRYL